MYQIFIHIITENRLRHTSGPVHYQNTDSIKLIVSNEVIFPCFIQSLLYLDVKFNFSYKINWHPDSSLQTMKRPLKTWTIDDYDFI